MRVLSRPTAARRALAAATACAALLTACSAAESADPAETAYEDGAGISAQVHPQLAGVGEDVADADSAEYVVDVRIKGADRGREVELQVQDGDAWTVVDSGETDRRGTVALTTPAAEEARVVSEGSGEDETVGVHFSTSDAPEATYTDEFHGNELGDDWVTRAQGYMGVRLCSRADDSAATVGDGVLRLSVLDDPKRELCRYEGKPYKYRLNGHIGTEHAVDFRYGYAAARMKFQKLRGQHASFWLQTYSPLEGQPKDTGAEIDVIEWFGSGHSEGGLTSFVYWKPPKKPQVAGGWVKKPEQYGKDWAKAFHVFSVEWTPKEYVFRIDGQVTHRIREGVSGQPQFLVLSLLSSDYELKHLDGDDNLPQHLDVDWVRVWGRPQK